MIHIFQKPAVIIFYRTYPITPHLFCNENICDPTVLLRRIFREIALFSISLTVLVTPGLGSFNVSLISDTFTLSFFSRNLWITSMYCIYAGVTPSGSSGSSSLVLLQDSRHPTFSLFFLRSYYRFLFLHCAI